VIGQEIHRKYAEKMSRMVCNCNSSKMHFW